MTIAACYVSSEGVILGSDSTSTVPLPKGVRHYDHEQKLFEIGDEGSTLGLMTWGMGQLPDLSYRQLAADLSDDLIRVPPTSVRECVERWAALFWKEYSTRLNAKIQRYQSLLGTPVRTPLTLQEMLLIENQTKVGFCLGGHVRADRAPHAYVVNFHPSMTHVNAPLEVARYQPEFWAADFVVNRLLKGIDRNAHAAILASGKWAGTQADLDAILKQQELVLRYQLPLREAIDWIYSLILITIKTFKFAGVPPVVGGPVEIAVITADRHFRWVCHKHLDQALSDHSVPEPR